MKHIGSLGNVARFAIACSAGISLVACSAILGLTDPTTDNSIGAADGSASDGASNESSASCGGVDLTTNSQNCGTCGHDCLGGACAGGACQPVLVVSSPTTIAPFFMAESSDTIYFSNAHTEVGVSSVASIAKDSIDGSAPVQIIGDFNDVGGGNSKVVYPYQIALTSSSIWVSLNAEEAINNAFQGGVTSCALTANSCPDNDNDTIPSLDSQAVATDGTFLTFGYADLVDGGFNSEQDKVKGFLMADPSNVSDLLEVGTDSTIAFLTIDSQNIYVAAASGVYVTNETGSPHMQLSTVEAEQLAVFDKVVYFTSAPSSGPVTVRSVPTTGGATTILAQGSYLTNPEGIAVDANYIYIADVGDKAVATSGAVYRCPLSGCGEDGGAATVLSTGAAAGGNPRTILASDSNVVFWGTRDGSLWKLAK